jgi:hypothetical protein
VGVGVGAQHPGRSLRSPDSRQNAQICNKNQISTQLPNTARGSSRWGTGRKVKKVRKARKKPKGKWFDEAPRANHVHELL